MQMCSITGSADFVLLASKVEKLSATRPATLAEAAAIPGITPNALEVLMLASAKALQPVKDVGQVVSSHAP
eukprot:6211188-Pleurochrysis_carterae.AAC.4